MKTRLFPALLSLAAFAGGVCAAPLSTEIAQAHEVVKNLIAAKRIPGFSIAVARGGQIVWSEGFGFANVQQGVVVTPLTRFRLGSASKIVTAAGLARLAEEGKIDLDAPVQRYVPDFPQKQWPITTRELAGHLAGIRHYSEQDFAVTMQGAPHFESVSASLAIFKNDPLLFEPGTKYSYSSYGWNLISAVMEGASGADFLTYMQQAVFDPLGLRSIHSDHALEIVPYRTSFYQRDPKGELRPADHVDNSYKWAGGGFLSNAEDLAMFGSAMLEPGFLRRETLEMMFTSQRLRSGAETGVGIAWRIGKDAKGNRVSHHGGTIDGGRAMIMMYPDSKVVVIMLSNILVDFGEPDAQEIGRIFLP
ncbi:MAG TPA: serine hydrolase domain-containing protein [Bryobacteraceae bacterium]|jgi:CubicO group peptidase (beta-lactamase class C family)